MITERPARILRKKDYGIAVGNPADLVVWNARTPAEAIATVARTTPTPTATWTPTATPVATVVAKRKGKPPSTVQIASGSGESPMLEKAPNPTPTPVETPVPTPDAP